MIFRFLAFLILVGTTFAQTATPPTAATVEVWPEGKMPGNGAKEPEAAAPAMIVCPGGGYGYTVIDKEGTEIAAWLNSAGISALVLKYRTADNRDGALHDAWRALSLAQACRSSLSLCFN
jgi:acetyl esterase/lipase